MSTAPRRLREDVQVPELDKSNETAAVDFTNTPEFQALVRKEVEKAVAAGIMAAQASSERAESPPAIEGGDFRSMMREMALAIAEVSDQGRDDRHTRIPPEVLVRREEAKQRMGEAIMETRANVKALREAGRKREAAAAQPRYRAIGKMYLNEIIIEPFYMDPGTKQLVAREFYWNGPPSEAMRPVNQPALVIFGHYRDWIGGISAEKTPEAWVTQKGLVMIVGGKSTPPASAMKHSRLDPLGSYETDYSDIENEAPSPFENELDVGDFNAKDPTRPTINVLGTLAPAARQGHPSDVVRRGF